jgi:hypothetical protein
MQASLPSVIKLYENPELGKELVKNMDQKFIKTHSWEREFQDYLHILNQLLPKAVDTNKVNNS